jgi:hypothetical protein
MANFLQRTLHPAWYHGHEKRPPFFEGWYYKLVDESEAHRYAVIPGIFLGGEGEPSHAFVQVLDGATGEATYHRYPVEDFWAAEDRFEVRIGPNRFTRDALRLEIDAGARRVSGGLRFEGLNPWPVTVTAPGVMGWYAWVPFMECYHGVLSFEHHIHGALRVDGREIDFGGGRGYMEKDWGRSFPRAWVWLQSHHFDAPGTCVTGSVAVIPWLGSAFDGFIVGLWHERRLYRFATYTGARIERLAVDDEAVAWVLEDRHHRLSLHATRAEAGLLRGPSVTDMGVRVPETLRARVAVRLTDRAGRVLFEGQGRHAGLEVAGDLRRLLAGR